MPNQAGDDAGGRRRREAELHQRALRHGQGERLLPGAARRPDRHQRRPHHLEHAGRRRRAVRRLGRPERDHADRPLPLAVQHAVRGRRPGTAVHLQRLDGRPLPARRGPAVLQPRARRVPGQPDRPCCSPTTAISAARTRPPTWPSSARALQAELDHFVKGDGTPAPSGVEAYLTSCPAPTGASPGPITRRRSGRGSIPARSGSSPSRPSASRRGRPAREPGLRSRGRGQRPVRVGVRRERLARQRHLSPSRGRRQRLHAARLADRGRQVRGPGRWRGADRRPPVGRRRTTAARSSWPRASYRPVGSGVEVFQLNANGWHFAAGHTPRLQLLGSALAVRARLQRRLVDHRLRAATRLPTAEGARLHAGPVARGPGPAGARDNTEPDAGAGRQRAATRARADQLSKTSVGKQAGYGRRPEPSTRAARRSRRRPRPRR